MASTDVEGFLDELPEIVRPIREAAKLYLPIGTTVDKPSGAIKVCPPPEVGTEAFRFVLFPGIKSESIDRYIGVCKEVNRTQLRIPPAFRALLGQLNGCFFLKGALFGIAPSMLRNPPQVDRTIAQPMDVGNCNYASAHAYYAPPGLLQIGYSHYDFTRNVGYFMHDDGRCETYLHGGQLIGEFPSLKELLESEIARVEKTMRT